LKGGGFNAAYHFPDLDATDLAHIAKLTYFISVADQLCLTLSVCTIILIFAKPWQLALVFAIAALMCIIALAYMEDCRQYRHLNREAADPLNVTHLDRRLAGLLSWQGLPMHDMKWKHIIQILTHFSQLQQPIHVIDMDPAKAITLIANASAPYRTGPLPMIDLRPGGELCSGPLPPQFNKMIPAERCAEFLLNCE
jgi:hypothetical protein